MVIGCLVKMTIKRSTTVVPCHSPGDDRKDICEKYAQHNFSTMFMPLLHTLRCFGLYYENENGSSGSRWTPGRVYCSIVLVIIWAAFLRSLLAYYENLDFGAELFLKLIYSSWVSRTFILLKIQKCKYRFSDRVLLFVLHYHNI